MRIRKAEKLLRRASVYPTAPPPSPPAPWDSASAMIAAAGILCELNRSLWVDDSISYPRENLEITKEDEKGVEEKIQDKKGQARRRREKEKEMAGEMNCKKTDGKGWHCKRASQLPHSLCSYHLTQLRSYRTRFEGQVSVVDNGGRTNRRKKSPASMNAGGAASNYYYILGSWWGKGRGPIDGHEGGRIGVDNSSESNNESEISPQERNDKTGHEALDDVNEEDGKVNYKKKMPHKKRGRKPVKARSLKSLL